MDGSDPLASESSLGCFNGEKMMIHQPDNGSHFVAEVIINAFNFFLLAVVQ